jgi:hypothetical protein
LETLKRSGNEIKQTGLLLLLLLLLIPRKTTQSGWVAIVRRWLGLLL